eukprot:673473-Rhodomonas_salina.6
MSGTELACTAPSLHYAPIPCLVLSSRMLRHTGTEFAYAPIPRAVLSSRMPLAVGAQGAPGPASVGGGAHGEDAVVALHAA